MSNLLIIDDDEYELYALNNPEDIRRCFGKKGTLDIIHELISSYGGVVFVHNLITDTFYYKG